MKAIVLAGGEGTRLRPLTSTRPKPLMPVADRPCIDYILRSLAEAGIRKIIIATHYLSDKLIKAIGDGTQKNTRASSGLSELASALRSKSEELTVTVSRFKLRNGSSGENGA